MIATSQLGSSKNKKEKKEKKKLVNCVISGKAFPNGPNPINISKPLQFIFEKKIIFKKLLFTYHELAWTAQVEHGLKFYIENGM